MKRSATSYCSQNSRSFDATWIDVVRCIAVNAVVIHHWLFFNSYNSTVKPFNNLAEIIEDVGGTAVHLFFIVSGCGLTISYFTTINFSWESWALKRIVKIGIPYFVITLFTFCLAKAGHIVFPNSVTMNFSWRTLIAYLTFARNFCPSDFELNPTMWYMPVIVGLYVLFPLFIRILKNRGVLFLVVISLLLTYGSITFCLLFGYPVMHQSALPFFFVIEFTFGILIGYKIIFDPRIIKLFADKKALCFGLFFYGTSWMVKKSWILGGTYNDFLTALGLFFLAYPFCQWIIRCLSTKGEKIVKQVSKYSYLMYLIHGPLILFIIRPSLNEAGFLPLDSLLMVCLGFVFCIVVYFTARIISPIINFLNYTLLHPYR